LSTWAIVVAAGHGTRFGASKQFAPLGPKRVVDRAVEGAQRAGCDGIVVVLPPDATWDGPSVSAAVSGGERRSDSVRAGLAAVPADAEVVVVHDAARPLASPRLYGAVIAAVRGGAAAAVPAVPVVDTVKRVEGGRVLETVARDDLVMIQTPQAFRADALRRAHEHGSDATDDAALVEAAGGTVVVVPGDPANLKVTTPDDLRIAAALLEAREDPVP
jgi:2-C-methyl-D-erythritol 4-phosphate cytidylyltransferase